MNLQQPLFDEESDWIPPEVLPEWENADVVSIDLETNDPHLKEKGAGWATRDGHVAGVALGLQFGDRIDTYYLPIGHEGGGNLDSSWVQRYLKDLCSSQIPKVFHNALYDIGWLGTMDITVRPPIRDTMYGAALLDENRMGYGLDVLGRDWVGAGKDEDQLSKAGAIWGFKGKNLKANMWRMPPKHVGPYAEQDALVTLKLWRYEEEMLERDDLTKLAQLEMDLIPMLYAMRKQGIRVDVEGSVPLEKRLVKEKESLIVEIKRKHGIAIEPWKADSLAKLFDAESLPYNRTPTGLPSFTKDFLGGHQHPVAQQILRIRKIDTTVNVFLKGQIQEASHNGRIYTELHSLKSDDGGTVSGRFSCSNPNLQQTSARDPELGPLVRGLFLPEQGSSWGALDYSSQEPRLTVHYAYLTHQQGAEDAVKGYRDNPRMDYHQMVADLAAIERKPAKTINLGLAYGMGEVKLCHGLGLPTEWIVKVGDQWTSADGPSAAHPSREIAGPEGKLLIKTYHEKVPFVKGLTNTCSNLAGERGWIRTIGNRLCRFDFWEKASGRSKAVQGRTNAASTYPNSPLKRAYTHKALNRLIQGSAADQTKAAMLEIHKQGITPMLQMHDELDFSFENEKEAKLCVEIMENTVPLEVPTIVDAEYGKTWGDAVHEWGR